MFIFFCFVSNSTTFSMGADCQQIWTTKNWVFFHPYWCHVRHANQRVPAMFSRFSHDNGRAWRIHIGLNLKSFGHDSGLVLYEYVMERPCHLSLGARWRYRLNTWSYRRSSSQRDPQQWAKKPGQIHSMGAIYLLDLLPAHMEGRSLLRVLHFVWMNENCISYALRMMQLAWRTPSESHMQ